MSPRLEYMRLCRLLDESLHPYCDLAAGSLTEEELEKNLLIALSEVLRQVKQWTLKIDPLPNSDSDEELLAETVDKRECSIDAVPYLDDRHCLARMIGDLISLLAVNSRFIQHLVGNTLVTIAEFVIASEGGWDDLVHLLCLCLLMAICSILPSSSESNEAFSDPAANSFLKPKLKCANWLSAASVLRVLRVIMKNVKQEDDKFMEVYLDHVGSLILNMPWNLLSKIHPDCNTEFLKCLARNESNLVNSLQSGEITVFYGHLIQFLCSYVENSSSRETGLRLSPVTNKICHIVPELVAWFHANFQSPHHVRISHYFRHKLLMLMIKLSSHFHDDTILLAWLHILSKFFEDLLLQPMSGSEIDQDDSSLEGSPFCTSLMDLEKQKTSSRHLQRLTIYIFLRCSLNLGNAEESNDESNPKCCNRSKGLVHLQKWLQAHVPADNFLCCELYHQRCRRFTSSFLQLFMHEDDILFETLLLLFHVPFLLDHQIVSGENSSELKTDVAFLASDLFNPVYLFHLFLAEILYDHQVLLDYLISNETGSSCAEYLLRSLRIVFNSWKLFIEFPGVEEDDPNQLLSKRQKVSSDELDPNAILPQRLELMKDVNSSMGTNWDKGHTYGSKYSRKYRQPFVDAKDCLLSLRTSIDSLSRKNLFPYNPEVLLRRLKTFEELCRKE